MEDTKKPPTPMSPLDKAAETWKQGAIILCVEYRSSFAETINWRDKATGRATSAPILRHTVEAGNTSIAVVERVPDNFNVETYNAPFKKGEIVLLHLSELNSERGVTKARGTLTRL